MAMGFFSKQRNVRKNRMKREQAKRNLLSNYEPATRYAEAYRTLRTNLHFAVPDKALQSLVITSSVQEEGKTTSAINIGHTMAQSGKTVLLVDMDLRKPMLTDLFELKKEKGVVDLLEDLLETVIASGNLTEISLWDLMQFIGHQKRTGTLNIQSDTDEVSLYFINGIISDLLWHNRPNEKKLINVLLTKDMLSKEEANIGLSTGKKTGRKIGAIFHSMGLVSKDDLQKILAIQAAEVIRVASTMEAGEFTFTHARENHIRTSFTPDIAFEPLFDEFIGDPKGQSCITRGIQQLIHSTDQENLFILGAGSPAANPGELLASKRTEFLIERLKQSFDMVIVDTPPVVPATDAMIMAPRTDGTLLVVRSGHTNRKVVKDVVDRYKKSGLPLLGVLLNRVDMRKEGYYYRYYQKYYASYYGEK